MYRCVTLVLVLIALSSQQVYSITDRQSLAVSMAQNLVEGNSDEAKVDLNGAKQVNTNHEGASPSNTASVQYMITKSMRAILEDELRYTVLEVDEMDPQIAARVIERMLPRPANGLPAEWRRDPVADSPSRRLVAVLRRTNRELIKPALPAIAAAAILLVNREAITEAVWSTAKEVEKIPPIVSEVISEKSYRWHQWWVLFRNRQSYKKSPRSKVDIDAFLKAQQTSLWDRLLMRAQGIKQ